MKNPFYGAPSGKSFEISWIFSTKYGSGNSMQNDLNMGWRSPIAVGAFVVISYGDPNDEDYDSYLNQDLNSGENTSYNSTLWEKIYDENKSENNGLAYKLIMSMTGYTPKIEFIRPIDILDANQPPDIIYDNSNRDRPKIKLRLPQSQVLSMVEPITVLNANQKPEVIYNDSNINRPKLTFKLPQSQVLGMNTTQILNADQSPVVVFDQTNINRPMLTFKLPQSQLIQLNTTNVVNADIKPSVTINNSNINRPALTFNLPQSQILSLKAVEILKANQNPQVTLDSSDINRPKLTFKLPKSQIITQNQTVILDADEEPVVIFDTTNIDNPKLTFKLPQSQVLSQLPTEILDANQMPEVVFNDSDINNPTLKFKIPQSQRVRLGQVTYLKANQKPIITLDTTDVNKPILNFQLPVSQNIQEGTTTVLNANEKPYFKIDSTDPDNPIFNLWLPQSQVMQAPETRIGSPLDSPNVNLNNTDINQPKLEFLLPRAVQFYYGSLLGERTNSPYKLTSDAFIDYGVGDYYINAATGFVYKISSKLDDTTCIFEYVACIQSPLPEVESEEISPYTPQGEQNTPTITRVFTNNQQTAWKIIFGLPKAPKPALETEFIGSAENGNSSVTISDSNTMKFKFSIPRGSRMFSDISLTETTQLNYHIDGSKKGDLCVNPASGKVFIQTATDVWTVQQGSLKGPKGDALHIVKSYEFTSVDSPLDTLEAISTLVEADFLNDTNFWIDTDGDGVPDTSRMPKDDEILSVTWKDLDENSVEDDVSYWYYYNEIDGWQRVQLTAGFFSSIMTEYDEDNNSNKLYSTGYINSLIGGNIPVEDYNRKTFSVDQLLYMFEWGDFENADTDVFPPDSSYTRHTLSAEEILELISWGDLAKLKLQDKFDSLIWGELGVEEIPDPGPDIPDDKDNSLLWGDLNELETNNGGN